MIEDPRMRLAAAVGGDAPAVPAGTPAWITPELIRRTLEVWQPRSKARLTAEDAVMMIRAARRMMDTLARD